jgi:hypothetical protein
MHTTEFMKDGQPGMHSTQTMIFLTGSTHTLTIQRRFPHTRVNTHHTACLYIHGQCVYKHRLTMDPWCGV